MLTRLLAETDAVNTIGVDLLARAGLATTTGGQDAPNADLNGPLYRALANFGIAPADLSNVVDADLARVPSNREIRFLDYLRIMVVDLAKVRLAGSVKRIKLRDYEKEVFDLARTLSTLRETLWEEYKRYLSTGSPAVGRMCRESRNALDTSPYFPPFPPFGQGTL